MKKLCTICETRQCYTKKLCQSCYTRERRQAIKKQAVDQLGGACAKCGYAKSMNALHFHHLDPARKEFSVGKHLDKTFARVEAEIEKCILLCANCHAELHAQ